MTKNYATYWIKFEDNGEYIKKPVTNNDIITTPFRDEALPFIFNDTYDQREILRSYIEGLPKTTNRLFNIEVEKTLITHEVIKPDDVILE